MLMKNKTLPHRKISGFTLVELLVVIVIIAALAAITFSLATKMRKKGEAAKSIQNIRQIGALIATFSADNSMSLPAAELEVSDGSGGTTAGIKWHQAIILDLYPDEKLETIRWDHDWWQKQRPVVTNPLMPDEKLRAWFPGYAMNLQIPVNLYGWGGDWKSGPKGRNVPLSMIDNPARTPLVSPHTNWFFAAGDFNKLKLEPFLSDGKVPLLFVDGHVETISPTEFVDRKLKDFPTKR
jgi:prepilin-type N-terminal cleavage/methylation domain-containing protein/prepilin-type processing-associated H-X9-DG protein